MISAKIFCQRRKKCHFDKEGLRKKKSTANFRSLDFFLANLCKNMLLFKVFPNPCWNGMNSPFENKILQFFRFGNSCQLPLQISRHSIICIKFSKHLCRVFIISLRHFSVIFALTLLQKCHFQHRFYREQQRRYTYGWFQWAATLDEKIIAKEREFVYGLTLFRMGLFGTVHRWREAKRSSLRKTNLTKLYLI